jgi:hypothetical protein
VKLEVGLMVIDCPTLILLRTGEDKKLLGIK